MKIRTILFYAGILILLPFAFKIKAGDFNQGAESISDLLFKSPEKLVQAEYESGDSSNIELKPLFPEKGVPIEI